MRRPTPYGVLVRCFVNAFAGRRSSQLSRTMTQPGEPVPMPMLSPWRDCSDHHTSARSISGL
jgi:hypothetical protein